MKKKSIASAAAALIIVIAYLLLGPTDAASNTGVAGSVHTEKPAAVEVAENSPEDEAAAESGIETVEPDDSIILMDVDKDTDQQPEEPAAPTEYIEYRFRSKKLLNDHYEKHGKEMGFASAAEYQQAASDVINDPTALHKTEAEDGDGVYYIEATNEFVILSTDGYIRTYFNPSGGINYYNRQ